MSGRRRPGHLKTAAGIMIIVMLFVVLFSSFYIAVEANHDCSGHDCPVCSIIHHCENTLHQLAVGSPGLIGIWIAALLVRELVKLSDSDSVLKTPVSMKVRMND